MPWDHLDNCDELQKQPLAMTAWLLAGIASHDGPLHGRAANPQRFGRCQYRLRLPSGVTFGRFAVLLIDRARKARTISGMARKQVVTVTDDIDGRAGAQTVSFCYAGRSYEVDLGEKNRAKLEKALAPFIGAARKVNGSAPSRRSPARAASGSGELDRAAVRAWAKEQGIDVSARGRLGRSVVEAYQAAH